VKNKVGKPLVKEIHSIIILNFIGGFDYSRTRTKGEESHEKKGVYFD
jgi:hypothetical protein